MRRGGLSGAALAGSGAGFDRVARRVHIDQDLAGDPLRARWLTWLFRIPGVELLNLWLPTDTLVRLQPLALMSTYDTCHPAGSAARSLRAEAQQARRPQAKPHSTSRSERSWPRLTPRLPPRSLPRLPLL